MSNCEDLIRIAKDLAKEVKITKEVSVHTDTGYPSFKSEFRHEHTNYDEVLNKMPDSYKKYPCVCDEYARSAGICRNRSEAYFIIKDAAMDLIEKVYKEQDEYWRRENQVP
jgi:hypothetical protein